MPGAAKAGKVIEMGLPVNDALLTAVKPVIALVPDVMLYWFGEPVVPV